MDLGVALPISGSWARPDLIAEVARQADELGYRSVWTFQRLLYAAPSVEGFGGVEGAAWPVVYQSVLDPLVALGYAAAVTSRVRLGVAVLNGLFYSPALLAKQLVSVDVVSSGRLEAGVGLGWSRTEYAASGVPFAGRGKRYEEFVHCVDALLRGDGSGFTGTYYTVPAATYLPRPVQQPRPPLYLGGGVETAVRRAAQLADGWISSSRAGLAGITRGVQWLRRYADGRPARAVARGVVRLRSQPAEERDLLEGTVEDMTGDLRRLADIGVDEVFLDLNFDPEVGTPAADPDESMRRCRTVLAALAP